MMINRWLMTYDAFLYIRWMGKEPYDIWLKNAHDGQI